MIERHGARRRRGLVSSGALGLGLAFATLLAAGCAETAPSEAPDPRDPVRPELGVLDHQLLNIDPLELLQAVDGGAACRDGTLTGVSTADTEATSVRSFICPRAEEDRTVWFLFADAWEAELRRSGANVGMISTEAQDAQDPVVRSWTIRGAPGVGSSRLVGVNGPGTLELYLSLDLTVP